MRTNAWKRCAVAIAVIGMGWSLTARAGRPLAVDDAGTVAAFQFELEAGLHHEHESDLHHWETPFGWTCGLPARWEIGAAFGWQGESRRGRRDWDFQNDVSDLTVAVKWNPLAADKFWADHAVAGSLKIPTADEDRGFGSGQVDFDLTYLASRGLTERMQADFNLGYTEIGGGTDLVHYGVAARWQTTPAIELVGEFVAETMLAGGNDTAVAVRGGTRWSLTGNLILDAAAGAGLNHHAPDWALTLGLTWTAGFFRTNH